MRSRSAVLLLVVVGSLTCSPTASQPCRESADTQCSTLDADQASLLQRSTAANALGTSHEKVDFVKSDGGENVGGKKGKPCPFSRRRHTTTPEPQPAQWQQVGQTLNGSDPSARDDYGLSVSLTDDGSSIAIGVPMANRSAGQVLIFELDTDKKWVQKGLAFEGSAPYDDVGGSVSLTGDGSRVALTRDPCPYPRPCVLAAQVLIFDWHVDDKKWVQKGRAIDLGDGCVSFGCKVSFNDDGSRLAIGASAANLMDGQVLIYELDTDNWVPKGQVIKGAAGRGEVLGYSVSLSATGSRVAIGVVNASGGFKGQVRIFDLDANNKWVQKGRAIDSSSSPSPTNATDMFGRSVSLNGEGSRVAIGASFVRNSETGQVMIFDLDTDNEWVRKGQALDAGNAVSLNEDGSQVAVGCSGCRNSAGNVTVFELGTDNTWVQKGQVIAGIDLSEGDGLEFGYSVSLSGDGSRVAAGAPYSQIFGDLAGQVRIFDYDSDN